MITEAQKKANQKYKLNVKRFTVDFTPAEIDLYNHLANQENKQRYIKRLIKNDMSKSENNR